MNFACRFRLPTQTRPLAISIPAFYCAVVCQRLSHGLQRPAGKIQRLEAKKPFRIILSGFRVNGGVAERSNAPVLKTGEPQGSVGSNPTPSAINFSAVSLPPSLEPPAATDPTPESARRVSVYFRDVYLHRRSEHLEHKGFIQNTEFVMQTHEVMENLERLFRDVMEMESSRRGFLLTGDEQMLRGYEIAQEESIESFQALKRLMASSPERMERLGKLQDALRATFELHEAEIEARRTTAAKDSALFSKGKSVEVIQRIRQIIIDMEGEQRQILIARTSIAENRGTAAMAAVFAGAILTLLSLVGSVVLILRDLGARWRAEEALAQEHNLLSSIINALPVSVYVKDVKGRYILDNNAHREYLGLDDVHSIEGKTVFDYYRREIAERFDQDDRDVVATGASILNREEPALRIGAEHGVEFWLETNKVPLLDTDGKIVGIVGSSADITQRKLAEERLTRFAEQLERSNAELQNFASVASHDLQEPLRKIQAFGDRLKAKCGAQLGTQGLDYLARMQNAAERMQTLIQDLLKLSRVTSRGSHSSDAI